MYIYIATKQTTQATTAQQAPQQRTERPKPTDRNRVDEEPSNNPKGMSAPRVPTNNIPVERSQRPQQRPQADDDDDFGDTDVNTMLG